MALEDCLKKVLFVINIIYAVFGLATSATGLWFLVQITAFFQLRNTNYLLDPAVYWPQVAPWMFIIVGILITLVACFGWSGTSKESCRILRFYAGFVTFMIVFKNLSSFVAFVFFNSNKTEIFIMDTIYNGYYNTHYNLDAAKIYELIERKLKCCGANDAKDYKSFRNDLPLSCCADYPCRTTCDFAEAIKRPGCAKAAAVYIKTISFSMAAALLLPTVLEVSGIIVARRLSQLYKEVEHYSKPMY